MRAGRRGGPAFGRAGADRRDPSSWRRLRWAPVGATAATLATRSPAPRALTKGRPYSGIDSFCPGWMGRRPSSFAFWIASTDEL